MKKLLHVLLVDDEPFIRQGLAVLIDWEKEGFFIAGEASNGKEALQFLRKEKADLVIADIKMPEMGGLELLEAIRQEEISKVYVAILSGFYEFEYAKEAIRNQCVDYILKPIQKEELLNLLSRVRTFCEEELENRELIQEMERAYLEKNLLEVVTGKFDEETIKKVQDNLKYSNKIRFISLEISSCDEEFQTLSEKGKREVQRKLFNRLREILQEDRENLLFDVSRQEDSYDMGFVFCDTMALKRELSENEYFEGLLQESQEQFPYKVVMQVGCEVDEIRELTRSYHAATIAKAFLAFRNDKVNDRGITFYQESMEKARGMGISRERLDSLVKAVEFHETERLSELVEEVYEEINAYNLDYELIRLNINYLLMRLIHLAAEQDDHLDQEEIMRFIGESSFDVKAMRGSSTHFKSFVKEFSDYILQLRQNAAHGVLSDVEKDIKENYAENISLKTLSEKYYINSAYLGQIFKRQFGLSFKDYLNGIRIENAASLLLKTDKRVYEIAESVGYKNLDYFINKFVTIKGCTPARFRKTGTGQESF